ncbi:MAG: hypothetical protein IKO61_09130 [Lachnospiraceae bacterium]|nr:hypothetical protein [Lachnospiraceae bacterium]
MKIKRHKTLILCLFMTILLALTACGKKDITTTEEYTGFVPITEERKTDGKAPAGSFKAMMEDETTTEYHSPLDDLDEHYFTTTERITETETERTTRATTERKTTQATVAQSSTVGYTSYTPNYNKDLISQIAACDVTAVGDSIMLGGSDELKKLIPSIYIDAVVGRQFYSGRDILKALKDSGALADTVIIGLGTNGSFSQSSGQDLIDHIGTDHQIFWINVYGPTLSWTADSNATIQALCDANSNVTLIDWNAMGGSQPGLVYDSDHVHLTPEGTKVYAELVAGTIATTLNQ